MLLFIPRIILASLWVSFSCFMGILAGIVRPFNPKNTKICTDFLKHGHHILGLEIELRNKEILAKNQPCVFISNHQDNLDIFPGSFTLPANTVTIGKKSILFIPFFGQFFWLCGNILIDRKNKKRAFEAMDTAANAIKEKNLSVWIMPEGTRSRGRGILPFKKGPFVTAIKAQVPIVPIAISSYTNHINLKKWHAGKILIEVMPAIQTDGMTKDNVDELKNIAQEMITQSVKKLDFELEKKL